MVNCRRSQPNLPLAIPLLLLAVGCAAKPKLPASSLDLVRFQEMALAAGCADQVNRLFLIDDEVVFWETRGNCADASYSFTLFGGTPDLKLCVFHDSIAGPVKECSDPDYQQLFDAIIDHSEEQDLGLGTQHTVEPIQF